MRKVLFIIGDYLPNRNGGTIRVEKLIKYFPEFGLSGIVLTKRSPGLKSKEDIEGTVIYRTNPFDIPLLYQKMRKAFNGRGIANKPFRHEGRIDPVNNERLANYFFVPDVDLLWALGAYWKTRKIVKKSEVSIIYTSAPTYSAHILGLLQACTARTKVQWVAEFRDPWTFNPFRSPKPYLLERFEHYLEKLVIKYSDKVIVTSEVYKEKFLLKYAFLNEGKIECIPNGYDPDDFKGIEICEKGNTKAKKIVHAGNFYGKRSVKPFLVALNRFNNRYPEFASEIEFVQYGTIDPVGQSYLNQSPNPNVKICPPIPHKDSLKEICNADWLLLIPGPGIGTTTGKLYEYLASTNPILAIVDEGSAKDLINELGVGYTIGVENIDEIVQILHAISLGNSKFSKSTIDIDKIKRFDRKIIAEKVVRFLK